MKFVTCLVPTVELTKVWKFDFLKFGHFGSVFCVFQKRCFCENFRTLVNCLARTRGVEKFIFVLERVYIHRKWSHVFFFYYNVSNSKKNEKNFFSTFFDFLRVFCTFLRVFCTVSAWFWPISKFFWSVFTSYGIKKFSRRRGDKL